MVRSTHSNGEVEAFYDGSTLCEGTLTTEVGSAYLTLYEEHLIADILRGKGRLMTVEYLITSLYATRREPEWPEATVKVILSNARKKLRTIGRVLVCIVNRGYKIVKEVS